MEVSFDPGKDARNRTKHGISLRRTEDFAFDSALYLVDDREDYGETRYRALGFLDGRLHALIFADVAGAVRAISLRKATKQEQAHYGNFHQT